MSNGFRPTSAKTLVQDVMRLADFLAGQDKECRAAWARDFNLWMDGALEEDAFGTEGQSDPRGDHRN